MATSRAAAPLAAFVLHRYDWSESSLIVELFTRPLGRIAVVARGAKKPTSNFRPVLLPFSPLLALLGRAPADDTGEVRTLRSAEWAGGGTLLGAAAMFPAFYLNELLLKLLPRQDAHPVLFDVYADTLAALGDLNHAGAEEGAALRAFELALLRELGWLPDLALATQTAQPLQPEARYTLDAEAGITTHAKGLAGAAWVDIETALKHGPPTALRAACCPVATVLRAPLRAVLHYHLGHSRLRTRDVLQGVQQLALSP